MVTIHFLKRKDIAISIPFLKKIDKNYGQILKPVKVWWPSNYCEDFKAIDTFPEMDIG